MEEREGKSGVMWEDEGEVEVTIDAGWNSACFPGSLPLLWCRAPCPLPSRGLTHAAQNSMCLRVIGELLLFAEDLFLQGYFLVFLRDVSGFYTSCLLPTLLAYNY